MALLQILAIVMTVAGLSMDPGPASVAASAPGGKLKLGKTYTETFTTADTVTGYDVKLPSSGKLTMTLDLISGDEATYHFSIYDREDNMLIACDLDKANKHVEESYDLVGGNYVLGIDGLNTVGTVSFKLDFVPIKETFPDTTENRHDTPDTAAKLALNKSILGHFAINDDRDMYALSIPRNSKMTLVLSTKNIMSMDVYLMNRTGEREWVREGVSSGKSVWNIVLEKGQYTLAIRNNDVRAYTGTYKLKTKFDTKNKSLQKIKLKKVKNIADKSVKIVWKKVSNVSGYEIQISRKKKFDNYTESQRIDDLSNTSITFFGLDKKKSYYVRVRCYNEYISGKTAYSKWTKVTKVKIVK